jgi:hypothetical protein
MHKDIDFCFDLSSYPCMPRQKPAKIKENFADYKRFLETTKTVEHHKIPLAKTADRKNHKGRTAVNYPTIQGDKIFEAEICVEDATHYRFKLFALFFDPGPVLRFDSKGKAHCNPEWGQGLRNRRISTPHFHKFFEEFEVEIAYKTPKLGQRSSFKVGDYKLGLEHFCQEASLSCNPSGTPVLTIEQGELALTSEDPLNGVSF